MPHRAPTRWLPRPPAKVGVRRALPALPTTARAQALARVRRQCGLCFWRSAGRRGSLFCCAAAVRAWVRAQLRVKSLVRARAPTRSASTPQPQRPGATRRRRVHGAALLRASGPATSHRAARRSARLRSRWPPAGAAAMPRPMSTSKAEPGVSTAHARDVSTMPHRRRSMRRPWNPRPRVLRAGSRRSGWPAVQRRHRVHGAAPRPARGRARSRRALGVWSRFYLRAAHCGVRARGGRQPHRASPRGASGVSGAR